MSMDEQLQRGLADLGAGVLTLSTDRVNQITGWIIEQRDRTETDRHSVPIEPDYDDSDLIFMENTTSTLRYVTETQRWRMEDDRQFVAEFIADGEAHAMLVAQHIIRSYDEWFGGVTE